MPPRPLFDVAVIGYGPVGATLANLLGRDGIRTIVVERETAIYDKPRAITFDHEAMRVFQSVGLAADALACTGPYRQTHYLNANKEILRLIDSTPPPFPFHWQPNYMFDQPRLEAALRAGAGARDCVDIRLGHELRDFEQDDEGVTLTLRDLSAGDDDKVSARFLVGADGAGSPVRQAAGIALEDLEFDEPWLVVDAHMANPEALPDYNIQLCDPARPMTYVIGPGNHRRWEIMLLPGEDPAEIAEHENILSLLKDFAPAEEFSLWRSAVYRFHALIARHWRRGRVLLTGDAAHQMPPFMGQGMCQGIRDAANIAWKLRLILREGFDERLLVSYQIEREPHVRTTVENTIGLGRIICELNPAKAAQRDQRLLAEMSAGGPTIRQKMIPDLSAGILDRSENGPNDPAGRLFPQPIVIAPDGREAPLDDALGHGFLAVCRERPPPLPQDLEGFWRRIGGKSVVLRRPDEDMPDGYRDRNGILTGFMDDGGWRLLIARPDGYIFGASRTAGTALFSNLARRMDA